MVIREIERIEVAETVSYAKKQIHKWSQNPGLFPNFIFIDLHIDDHDGNEFARYIQGNYYRIFPVMKLFILTSSEIRKNKERIDEMVSANLK